MRSTVTRVGKKHKHKVLMSATCQSPYATHGEGTELCGGDKSTQAFLTNYGLSSPKTDTMESSPRPKFLQTRRRPSSAPAVRDEAYSPVVSPSWLISPARRPRHVAGVTDQISDRPLHVEGNRAICTSICKTIYQGDTCADNNTSIWAEELREPSTGDFYGDEVVLVDRGRMRVLTHKLRELARENALLRDAVRCETLVDGTGRRRTAQLRMQRRNLESVAALRTAKNTVFQKTSRAQDKTRALQSQIELERLQEFQQSVAGPGSRISLIEGASDNLISDRASAASESRFLPEIHDKLDVDAFTRSALDHSSYKPCSASRLSTESRVGVGCHRFECQGQPIVDCNFDKATCIAGEIISLTTINGGTREEEKGLMKAKQEGSPADQHRDNTKLDGVRARHGAVPETLLSREEEAVCRRDERAAPATGKQEDQLKTSSCFRTNKLCVLNGPDWATIKMRQDIARKQRIRERALQLATSSSLPSRMAKRAAMHAMSIANDRNNVEGGLGSGKAREARPGVAIPKEEPEEIIRGIVRQQRRWEASLVAAKEALRTAVTRSRTPPMEKRRRIQEAKWRAKKESAERAAREEEAKERSEHKRCSFLRQLARYRESTVSHTPRETVASRKKAEETRRRAQQSLHDQEKQQIEAGEKAARQREVSRAVRIYVERSEARRREKHGARMPLDELVRQKQEEKRAEFRQRWQHNRRGLRQALRKRPNLLERQDQLAQLHYKQRAAEAQTATAFLKSREGFEAAGRRAAAGSPSRSEGLARETATPTEKSLWGEEQGGRDSADGSSTCATRQDDGGGGFVASTQDGEIDDIVASAPHGGVVYDDKRLSSESTPLKSDEGGDGSGDSSGGLASGGEEQTAEPPENTIE